MPLAALAVSLATSATAATIFADNFDDGDVTDWTLTTNFVAPAQTTLSTSTLVSHSSPNSLQIELFSRQFDSSDNGSNLFVRGSRTFSVAVAGDYVLSLYGRSTPNCIGCVISYDVLFDGNFLDLHRFSGDLELRTYELDGLAAGNHTITLGMFTTGVDNGNFRAFFDDVSVDSVEAVAVSEPGALGLLALGLVPLWAARRRKPH
jgi:hypothetical protein